MAVEIVVLIPILVAFMLLIVAFGRYVDMHGDVESVTRDAVRAASLERTYYEGQLAAQAIVDQSLPNDISCSGVYLDGDFVSGGVIAVRLECSVDFSDLGLVGVPGVVDFTKTSSAPIDNLRRTG